MDLNNDVSNALSLYYHQLPDIERISDYAIKIENYSKEQIQNKLNNEERETIKSMFSMCMERKMRFDIKSQNSFVHRAKEVCENLRRRQMQRMKEKSISSEVSMLFSQLLNDFERISGHALNIAQDYELISHSIQIPNE